MNYYQYLFLPVDGPIEDGCTVIDVAGVPFEYSRVEHYGIPKEHLRRAEPFIVGYEYNMPIIIGKASEEITWLKNGDDVAPGACEINSCIKSSPLRIVKVRCPNCGSIH